MQDKPTLSNILLIDDSSVAGEYLTRAFSSMETISIDQSTNFREAVERISHTPPDLIVCEWLLDEIKAEKLIKGLKAHDRLKSIPIIIHTGMRRDEIVQEAMKLGADATFYKPFEPEKLIGTLKNLFNNWDTNAETTLDSEEIVSDSPQYASKVLPKTTANEPKSIRSQLRDIEKLAPMPQAFSGVMEVMRNPNSTASQLSEVIKMDQALTAKILKIVNSAYYGFYRRIGNVQHAIVILGFSEIKNITLAACIIQAYGSEDSPHFKILEFWRHSLAVAYIARSLSTLQPDFNSEDAFSIGLMHDLGKVVLDQHFSSHFHACLETSKTEQRPLHQVCLQELEIDHAEVGAIIAESWKLPVGLVKAIQYHHQPENAEEEIGSVYLAHLANYFCHRQKIGESGNPVPDEALPEALEYFGIKPGELDQVWESLKIDEATLKALL
ncbi:HDOD domain-containing protein [Calditrichota bacterium]